jgi:hypothetical protein
MYKRKRPKPSDGQKHKKLERFIRADGFPYYDDLLQKLWFMETWKQSLEMGNLSIF